MSERSARSPLQRSHIALAPAGASPLLRTRHGVVALVAAAATLLAIVAPHTARAADGTALTKTAAAPAPRVSSHWTALTRSQQEALAPLGPHWDSLSDAQRRKWLALSRNFNRIGPAEQAKLHARMTDWAALSPRQRALARLNYAEVRSLAPADQRKAEWEAYMALSPEERQKLAESAGGHRIGAAPAARPVSNDKLVPVPATAFQQPHGGPRIQITPSPGPEAANVVPVGDGSQGEPAAGLSPRRNNAEPTATAP